MRNVFLNPDHEREFDKMGFVPFNLLNDEEVAEVQGLLQELKNYRDESNVNVESDYKLSFFNKDGTYRAMVRDKIYGYFKPRIDQILDNYEPLIINVFDKEPGGGEVPIHQNWTFVDESEFTSVSVWIPMCNVSRENGTLEVVPGSHRVLSAYRSPSIPWCFVGLEDALKEKYMQPFNFKTGQIGILDDGILHYSSDNDSDSVRTTIQLIMVPKDAMPLHYYRTGEPGNEKIEIFEVDSDFFTTFDMHQKPEGVESKGFIDFETIRYDEAGMVDKIALNYPEIKELV